MRVWLPLVSARRSMTTQDTSFISKRIMLLFELDICPLVICSNDCLAIGVESLPMSFHNVKCSLYLPHFAHSLELLLHGVLEEEATSSEPIRDPLLPRCVAFIQEFPEFLRTVAHCARKTELALWSSLFSVTGSPNDLFEVCIRDGQLLTAASYLIVLQSIESAQTSQEQALRLLREALSAGEWSIAKDMVPFTRAIGSEDMDSPARTPSPYKTSSRRHAASINSVAEADDLVFARFQAALSDTCQECKFAVDLLHDAWGEKTTEECVGDLAIFICRTFRIEDNFICKGIVRDFSDEFMYVLGQIIVEPHQICGLLLDDCGKFIDPFNSTWSIPIPNGQPAPIDKQPVPGGKPVLKVLHLTDIHLDMLYTPGLEAKCAEPQCCRPQQDPDEVSVAAGVKEAAGQWGTVGNCDAPYWLLTNMLAFIQKNHKDLDYVMVSGDLTSHADWDYTRQSHVAIVKNISDTIRS
ncbi:unnamed protein product [Cylicocyclus nassatus]|uniref:Protein RIC1 homolog n=1 Tax=Cylicocyclus nassatus TaxID=53992 RepID=A0AA36HF83_CYLNA|nr:unnamed protein product [Cylicocyclus nassatus]